jgi:hypothetical protein
MKPSTGICNEPPFSFQANFTLADGRERGRPVFLTD